MTHFQWKRWLVFSRRRRLLPVPESCRALCGSQGFLGLALVGVEEKPSPKNLLKMMLHPVNMLEHCSFCASQKAARIFVVLVLGCDRKKGFSKKGYAAVCVQPLGIRRFPISKWKPMSSSAADISTTQTFWLGVTFQAELIVRTREF